MYIYILGIIVNFKLEIPSLFLFCSADQVSNLHCAFVYIGDNG